MIIDCKFLNPDNPRQAFVFFDDQACNEPGHPSALVPEIGKRFGFKVLDSQPSPMAGGWFFWLEGENPDELPVYFNPRPWRPVGSK